MCRFLQTSVQMGRGQRETGQWQSCSGGHEGREDRLCAHLTVPPSRGLAQARIVS